MRGFRPLSLALTLCFALPLGAMAQRETDATKEAEKQLALAMLQDASARTPMYEAALAALQQAFTADADNSLVWFLGGQAYVGLGRYEEGAEALDRAVQLNPDHAEEAEAYRESGWIASFNRGVELMATDPDAAIEAFDAANALYPKRPEGFLNVASLRAGKGEMELAIEALEQTIIQSDSDLFPRLDSATQANWIGMREIARANLAQLEGAVGVDAFNAQQYDTALEWFERAFETNPHSRDYAFNVLQARWAQASQLDQQSRGDETTPLPPQTVTQLTQMFEGVKAAIPPVREMDPNNETVLAMLAQAERRLGHIKGDSAGGDAAAYAVVEQIDALPVTVDDVLMTGETQGDQTSYTITGELKNRKLDAGASVTINFTLIGINGEEVGQSRIQVSTPPPETMTEGCDADPAPCTTMFEGVAQVSGDVAGWRYVIET